MSSTRYAAQNSPLNQNRYASSPEFAELRGISGTSVSARTSLIQCKETRALLWFIQGISLKSGGLKSLANQLLEMFRDRIGTRTMRELKAGPSSKVCGNELYKIHRELGFVRSESVYLESRKQRELEYASKEESGHKLIEICTGKLRESLGKFLVDLCINPRLIIATGKDKEFARELYTENVLENFPELQGGEIETASLPLFENIIGALFDYKRLHEEKIRADFVLTAIGEKVWSTLDHALKIKGMVLVEGFEGRGKSEATRAWCEAHAGVARFVSLAGITGKTNVFRSIAKALGIASGFSFKSNQLQARIEDVLQQSGMALILDEAHWLLDPKPRMYARPEMIDWLDTALCNHRVPVGLISTPQFLKAVHQAVEQTGWNFFQFQRRVSRFVVLPAKNSADDIKKVARKLLPRANETTIKLVLGYAQLSARDLSAVGDVIRESRIIAQDDGREEITFADVDAAINEVLLPTDTAFAVRLQPQKTKRQKLLPLPAAPLPADRSETEVTTPRRQLPTRGTDHETLFAKSA